jgi:hypothetical protein
MVTLSDLRLMQDDARTLADDLGVVTRDLTDKELGRFGRSYTRQFIRALSTRQMADVHLRHQKEGLLGAMIAKEQMEAEVDDEIPASNKIGGPLAIRACWFGIGDDWEDIGSIYGTAAARGQGAWTTGAAQNWIHSGSFLLGGTDGNAIRIGENAVHVIYGMYSLHASPKLESVQFTIDGKQKPAIYCGWAQKTAIGFTQRIKEFDNAFILKKDTTFLAQAFFSGAFGVAVAQVTDFLALYGVSYIKEPAVRLLDPVTGVGRVLPGARFDVVWTT